MSQGDSESPRERGYSVLYADARGVSRIYQMSLDGLDWQVDYIRDA